MSKYTDEELMDMLEGAEEVEGPLEYSNNVVPFLSRFSIHEGNYKVPASILYKLYKTYTKDPYPKKQFVLYVNDILIEYVSGTKKYYKLNIDAMKISKEYYRILSEKKRDDTKNMAIIKHFNGFITSHGLRPGNNWVEGFIIYEIYKDKYRRMKHKPKMSYNLFTKMLKLHFECKRITSSRSNWFGLNEEYKKFISPEKIEAIRESREKKRRREKAQKRKKKQEGLSGSPVSTPKSGNEV